MATIPSRRNSAVTVDQLPLKTLMINIGLALASDAAIEAWCQAEYGKSLAVFCGTDEENPPSKEDCPYVEVGADMDNFGREIPEHIRGVFLGVVIHDKNNTMTEVAQGLGIVRGANNLEELWPLVVTAACGADLLGGYVSQVVGKRDKETLFPFFVINGGMVVKKPV